MHRIPLTNPGTLQSPICFCPNLKVQTADQRCSVPSLPNLPPCNLRPTTTCQPQDDRTAESATASLDSHLSTISTLTLGFRTATGHIYHPPICPAALCKLVRVPTEHRPSTCAVVAVVAVAVAVVVFLFFFSPHGSPRDHTRPLGYLGSSPSTVTSSRRSWTRHPHRRRPQCSLRSSPPSGHPTCHPLEPTWPVLIDRIPSRWRTYASLSDVLTAPDGRATATAPLEIPQRFELLVTTARPSTTYPLVPIHTSLPHTKQ
jgi:hypothetical protein